MHILQDQLHQQALRDLTNRAKSGTFVYLVTWLALTLSFDIHHSHPIFFQVNTFALILFAVVRVSHQYISLKANRFSVKFLTQWITLALLLCALHWGITLAWILASPGLSIISTHFLVVSAAFALGGSCTLSISNKIRLLYPNLMLVPASTYFLLEGSVQSLVFAFLCVVTIVYIVVSSKASHADYWKAITSSRVAEERAEELQKLSITDPLTQINNRMYFENEYTNEWRRAKRLGVPISILMIDIDHFKKINDTFGHLCGDQCLIAAAKVIKESLKRPSDCIARYGGEEFIALLPSTDWEGAEIIGKRIIKAISKLQIDWDGRQVTMTVSVGGASVIPREKSIEDKSLLIRRADFALYEAKNSGRNCYKAELSGSI